MGVRQESPPGVSGPLRSGWLPDARLQQTRSGSVAGETARQVQPGRRVSPRGWLTCHRAPTSVHETRMDVTVGAIAVPVFWWLRLDRAAVSPRSGRCCPSAACWRSDVTLPEGILPVVLRARSGSAIERYCQYLWIKII